MLTLYSKMGEITFSQKGQEKKLDIWSCNALVALAFDYTEPNGLFTRQLYMFIADTKHAKTIVKNYGKNLFEADGEVKVTLNLYYPSAKKVLTIFTKYFGLKVECYYEEVK